MDDNLNNRTFSDSMLLSAIQKGSNEAAEELCRRQDSELLMVVAGFLRDNGCNNPSDHAKGIKNNAWINIIRYVSSLKDVNKFKPWRDTIAKNEAKRHLKVCITEQNTSVEIEDDTLLPEAQISDYYKSRDAAIDADKILLLAESISPEFALLFRLHTLYELGFDEIAVKQGKNKDALRTAYYRGLKILKAKLRLRGG